MPKNKKILFLLLICGLVLTLVPSFVLAANKTSATLTNPLGKNVTLQIIIGRVISAVLGVVGSIALLMFIYGGFLWLTSAGVEQKITQGKQIITWATIGLAVIFLSYTLVGFVITGLTKGGTAGGTAGGGVGGGAAGGGGEAPNPIESQISGCCIETSADGGKTCYASTDAECVGNIVFYASKRCDDLTECGGIPPPPPPSPTAKGTCTCTLKGQTVLTTPLMIETDCTDPNYAAKQQGFCECIGSLCSAMNKNAFDSECTNSNTSCLGVGGQGCIWSSPSCAWTPNP